MNGRRSGAGGPVNLRLLRSAPGSFVPVACSVGLGLVSAAAIVVQAIELARVIASTFHEGAPIDRGRALVVLGVALGVRSLVAGAGPVLARLGAARAKAELRARTAARLLAARGPMPTPGTIAAVMGAGVEALEVYVGSCLPNTVLASVAPLGLLAVVGSLDWLSGVIILVTLALFPVFGILVGRSSAERARERFTQVKALGGRVVDLVDGLPLLRSLGRVEEERAALERANAELRSSSLAALRIALLSAFVLELLASVATALVAVPLGLRLVSGQIHLAPALAVLIVTPEVFLPLRRASADFHASTEGLAAAGDVLAITDAPRPPARTGLLDPRSAAGSLELDDVVVSYASSVRPVLSGCTLRIDRGERVAILGSSGSGKSTLLLAVAALVEVDSGRVLRGGADLSRIDPASWRSSIAYLAARPTIVAGTVRDNLAIGDRLAGDEALESALVAVDGGMLLEHLAEGLDTLVGPGGRSLSAGERQRLALARCLLRPAELFLLDEPTAHLDLECERRAVEAIARRTERAATIIVTHQRAPISICHRSFTLRDGRLLDRAAPLGETGNEHTAMVGA